MQSTNLLNYAFKFIVSEYSGSGELKEGWKVQRYTGKNV